jgi:hypothetical protein
VTVERDEGPNVHMSPQGCADDETCDAWKLTPDGGLFRSHNGRGMPTGMAPADAANADAIIRSVDFRQMFAHGTSLGPGVVCDASPSATTTVVVNLTNQSFDETSDLTGCALSGPKGNAVQRLYELLSSRY